MFAKVLAGRIQNAVQQFYKLLWLFSRWNSKTDFPTLFVDGKFRSRLLFLDIRLQNVTRKLSFSCEQCTTVHGIISFHRGTYYYSLPLLLFQKPSIDFFCFISIAILKLNVVTSELWPLRLLILFYVNRWSASAPILHTIVIVMQEFRNTIVKECEF